MSDEFHGEPANRIMGVLVERMSAVLVSMADIRERLDKLETKHWAGDDDDVMTIVKPTPKVRAKK